MADLVATIEKGKMNEVPTKFNENDGIKLQKVLKGTNTKRVRQDIQKKVDRYLEFHKYVSTLNTRLKELRAEIEPYMDEKGLERIYGDKQEGSIDIVYQQRPEVNARYTTYDMNKVSKVISRKQLEMCLTKVVDREMIDYLIATDMIDKKQEKQLSECKKIVESKTFTVKRNG